MTSGETGPCVNRGRSTGEDLLPQALVVPSQASILSF
jgi:hypothetical protein